MSQVTRKGPTSPEMNMTPMIDVTFQLIIFFMLVNTIIAEETVEMIVPKLFEPRTKLLEDQKKVTINIAPPEHLMEQRREPGANPWDVPGELAIIKVGQLSFSLQELDGVTETLKESKEARPDIEILLRADGALYYQAVQPVMNAITLAGIENVNLVAYRPKEAPKHAPFK